VADKFEKKVGAVRREIIKLESDSESDFQDEPRDARRGDTKDRRR